MSKSATHMDASVTTEDLFDWYKELDQSGAADVDVGTAHDRDVLDEERYGASQWQLMWRRFVRNRAAVMGGTVTIILYLLAVFAHFVSPYTLTTRFRDRLYMPPQGIHIFHEGELRRPFVYGMELEIDSRTLAKVYTPNRDELYPIVFLAKGEPYQLWGIFEFDRHLFLADGAPVNWLGTDRQGRDMLSRILIGSQISLTIGLVGVFLSLLFGTLLGVASGYFGGIVDDGIQRLIELIRSFPSIPLWMALSAAVPAAWPPLRIYFAITLILSLIGWTWLARQLRGKVLALRGEDYVLAAKLMGASHRRIIFKHLIPATLGHIIVVSTLAMPAMILAETALSFLGLGLRAPLTSWGVLLQEAQNLQTIAIYPWLFIPLAFVVIAILAFNFLGDGLRDAADPYSR